MMLPYVNFLSIFENWHWRLVLYWLSDVTRQLLKHIQSSTKEEILDYLSKSIGRDFADIIFPADVSYESTKYLNDFQRDFLPEACYHRDKHGKDVVIELLSRGANPFSKGSKVIENKCWYTRQLGKPENGDICSLHLFQDITHYITEANDWPIIDLLWLMNFIANYRPFSYCIDQAG